MCGEGHGLEDALIAGKVRIVPPDDYKSEYFRHNDYETLHRTDHSSSSAHPHSANCEHLID